MSTLTVPRLVPIGQAARLANVHVDTIRYYADRGDIEFVTTPGGHRRVNLASVADVFGVSMSEDHANDGECGDVNTSGLVIVFARVSSKKQEQAGDLLRQGDDLKRYAATHYPGQKIRVLQGVGSGLNDSRREFLLLVDLIVERKCAVILCSYRERIARFGLNVIQHLCKANGVTIVETGGEDNERKERTLQEDMVESCLAVLHCFSAKMNGIRGGARTKIHYPPEFRDFVCQLAGAGLSLRAILAKVEKRQFRCLNTNKPLGFRAVRNILEEIRRTAPVVPVSVKSFLKTRCNVQAGKRETTANLFEAYTLACESRGLTTLTRDKFTEYLKLTVRSLRIENGAVSVAHGICLRQAKGLC